MKIREIIMGVLLIICLISLALTINNKDTKIETGNFLNDIQNMQNGDTLVVGHGSLENIYVMDERPIYFEIRKQQ